MKKKYYLAMVAVFFTGFVVGAVVFSAIAKYEAVHHPERGPEAFKGALSEYLMMKLEIRPTQMRKLEPILNRSFEKLVDIRRQSLPAVQKLAEETYREAQPLLTPEQASKAQALLSHVK